MINVGRCPLCNAFLIEENLATHRCNGKLPFQGIRTIVVSSLRESQTNTEEGHRIVYAKGYDGYLYRLEICEHNPPHTAKTANALAKRKFTAYGTKQGLDRANSEVLLPCRLTGRNRLDFDSVTFRLTD